MNCPVCNTRIFTDHAHMVGKYTIWYSVITDYSGTFIYNYGKEVNVHISYLRDKFFVFKNEEQIEKY